MATVDEVFSSIGERIRASARTETIYGDTRVVDGRGIIPVGKVRYGFGAGAGNAPGKRGREGAPTDHEASGGGGGGGVVVSPVGFLVVAAEGERFIPVKPALRELLGAFALGVLVGSVLVRRLLRG